MSFALLFAVPAVVLLAGFLFFRGFSWRELAAHVFLQAIVAAMTAGVVSCVKTSDTEVWNGRVARKDRVEVGCRHGYQCMCVPMCSGPATAQVCTTVCQTCYEHDHDVDWSIVTSNEERIAVESVDRQGLTPPPRWTASRVGEPTAVTHSYENFVKAVPDAFFSHRGSSAYASRIPPYPGDVFDYHRLDRLVLVDARVADVRAWNDQISELASDVGAPRQANVIVVLTSLPHDFFFALEEAWIGGKKNDVVAVVGQGEDGRVTWVEVMAWTIRSEFKSKLRADILALSKADDPNTVLGKIRDDVLALHQRRPMADFAYLRSTIVPSFWQWVVATIVSLLASCALVWVFHTYDPFGDAERRLRREHTDARRKSADQVATDAVSRGDAASIEEAIKDLRARIPSDYRSIDR